MVDTAYMTVFGCGLMVLQNTPQFLLPFGFHEPSFFVSLGLYIYLYTVSADVPLRAGLNLVQRYLETRADTFSVVLGFGISQKSALIRSTAKNLDLLFTSHIDNLLHQTHPGMFERVQNIETQMLAHPDAT